MTNIKGNKNPLKAVSRFDLTLIMLLIIAGFSVYFTFLKPIVFSNLIQREGVVKYAEVQVILPKDLAWIKEVVRPGEEAKDVYGRVGWKILAYDDVELEGEKLTRVKLKASVTEDTSKVLRFGKYILVKGNKIFFISDKVFLEGRVFDFHLLE